MKGVAHSWNLGLPLVPLAIKLAGCMRGRFGKRRMHASRCVGAGCSLLQGSSRPITCTRRVAADPPTEPHTAHAWARAQHGSGRSSSPLPRTLRHTRRSASPVHAPSSTPQPQLPSDPSGLPGRTSSLPMGRHHYSTSRGPTGGRVLEGVIKLPRSPPQARKFWRY